MITVVLIAVTVVAIVAAPLIVRIYTSTGRRGGGPGRGRRARCCGCSPRRSSSTA